MAARQGAHQSTPRKGGLGSASALHPWGHQAPRDAQLGVSLGHCLAPRAAVPQVVGMQQCPGSRPQSPAQFLPLGWGQWGGHLDQSGPSPSRRVCGLSPFLPMGEPPEMGVALSLWLYISTMKCPLNTFAVGKELVICSVSHILPWLLF